MKKGNPLLINCQQATYLHTLKQAGKLSLAEKAGLWLHLLFCKVCALFFKQLNNLEKATRVAAEKNNQPLSPEAKTRIHRALANELNKQ